MSHVHAKGNEYAAAVGRIYDAVPKAVFAAIAVSAITQGGDFLDEALERLVAEWVILYSQGLVPQRPPAGIRDLATKHLA